MPLDDQRFWWDTVPNPGMPSAGSFCRACGVTYATSWRRGPDGVGTLCASCGYRYRNCKLTVYVCEDGRVSASPASGGTAAAVTYFASDDLSRPVTTATSSGPTLAETQVTSQQVAGSQADQPRSDPLSAEALSPAVGKQVAQPRKDTSSVNAELPDAGKPAAAPTKNAGSASTHSPRPGKQVGRPRKDGGLAAARSPGTGKQVGRPRKESVSKGTLTRGADTQENRQCAKCCIRVCRFWRTGPDGPRSLCIRCNDDYRKMRLPLYQGADGRLSVKRSDGAPRVRHVGFEKNEKYRDLSRPITEPLPLDASVAVKVSGDVPVLPPAEHATPVTEELSDEPDDDLRDPTWSEAAYAASAAQTDVDNAGHDDTDEQEGDPGEPGIEPRTAGIGKDAVGKADADVGKSAVEKASDADVGTDAGTKATDTGVEKDAQREAADYVEPATDHTEVARSPVESGRDSVRTTKRDKVEASRATPTTDKLKVSKAIQKPMPTVKKSLASIRMPTPDVPEEVNMEPPIFVKARLKSGHGMCTRRFPLRYPLSYAKLRSELEKLFGTTDAFSIQYCDNEHDLVAVSSDMEVGELYRVARVHNLRLVHLWLSCLGG